MTKVDFIHHHQTDAGVHGLDTGTDEWDPTSLTVFVHAEIGLHHDSCYETDVFAGECAGDSISLEGSWTITDRKWSRFEVTCLCLCTQVPPHSEGITWEGRGSGHLASTEVTEASSARQLRWLLPPTVTDKEFAFIWKTLLQEFTDGINDWHAKNLPGTAWYDLFSVTVPDFVPPLFPDLGNQT